MNGKRQTQYTLRGVPRSVDEALRRKSKEDGKSINATALEALKLGLAVNGAAQVYHDLDFMIGTWVEDPLFDEAITAQDQIDPNLWK